MTGELKDQATVYANKDNDQAALWLGVSKGVFEKYARDNEDKTKALALIKAGRYGTTFQYAKDNNPKRWVLTQWMLHNYRKNFARYFKENKG